MVIRKILHGISIGDIKPSKLCETSTAIIRKHKALNAFVLINDDGAKNTAKLLDKNIKGGTHSSLAGLPIAIKDNFNIANMRTSCCSKMLEHYIPTYTATVVQKLMDAGAIVIGKTNMDEFAMGSGSVDSIYGPVRNPWDRIKERTLKSEIESSIHLRRNIHTDSDCLKSADDFVICGGSSGGSAVAVAIGAAYASLGSDTGGSTRNPASYCGVVGLKPTYGLLSRHGLIPLVNSMDVPGILTRTVNDAALILEKTAGFDSKDSTTVHHKLKYFGPQEDSDISTFKIGIPNEFFVPGLSSEVGATWEWIAGEMTKAGAKVVKVSLPHTAQSISCYSVLNACEVASNFSRYDGIQYGHRSTADESSTEALYASTRKSAFNHVVRGRILLGNYFLLKKNYEKYFIQSLKIRRLIKNDYDAVFGSGVDALLTPTTLTTAPLFSEFISKDNRTQCADQDYCTQPANMAGIPAISVPVKLSRSSNLPISLQLMAPRFEEHKMLTIAKWIENVAAFPHLNIS